MENVFDAIEYIYSSEANPQNILKRKEIEGYLRTQAWAGCNDEQLMVKYEQIFMIILYLQMDESDIGMLDRDDFIDMVAWLGRNIPGFELDEAKLSEYLDCWQDFFNYLVTKRMVLHVNAPREAKALLLPQGKLALLDREGNFLPEAKEYARFATPDPDEGVIYNLDNAYAMLKKPLQVFFTKDNYKRDYLKALELFDVVLVKDREELAPNTVGHEEVFWQYFLFDYHMLRTDLTPIQYFYEKGFAKDKLHWGKADRYYLEELQGTTLRIFSAEYQEEDGFYACRDFFTKEYFSVFIPTEENVVKKDWLLIGHLYGNDYRAMDYINSVYLPQGFRKKMLDQLLELRKWVSASWGHVPSWKEFISRYPLLVRHIFSLYSTYVMLESFGYQTKVQNYEPAEIPASVEPIFTRTLRILQRTLNIASYDMTLIRNMAGDFLQSYTINANDQILWCIAIVETFMRLNRLTDGGIVQGLEKINLDKMVKIVQATLQLEEYDPRYVNEHGLIMMTVAK